MQTIAHLIGGAATTGIGPRRADVFDPNTGGVQAQVALAETADFDAAVANAVAAQPAWGATNPQRRARVMFAFKALVEAEIDSLAHMLSMEHGKVIADSKRRHPAGTWR